MPFYFSAMALIQLQFCSQAYMFSMRSIYLLYLILGTPSKKNNRIFHDIVQNSFDTYPPYLIMTYYIYDIVVFFRHLPTFM